MNLVQQAIDTYKAIYGEEPTYVPYRGASDHPFEGVHPRLMEEMVNATEVRKIERNFKINLNKTHKSKEEIKVGDYVHAKKLNSYSDSVSKKGRVLFMNGDYYGSIVNNRSSWARDRQSLLRAIEATEDRIIRPLARILENYELPQIQGQDRQNRGYQNPGPQNRQQNGGLAAPNNVNPGNGIVINVSHMPY